MESLDGDIGNDELHNIELFNCYKHQYACSNEEYIIFSILVGITESWRHYNK